MRLPFSISFPILLIQGLGDEMANVFQLNPYGNGKLYNDRILQSSYYNLIRDKPFGGKLNSSVIPNNNGTAAGGYIIPFTTPIDSNFVVNNDYAEVVNDPTGAKEWSGSSGVAKVIKIKKQGLYLISSQIYIADPTANNYGWFSIGKRIASSSSSYFNIGEVSLNFADRISNRQLCVIDEIGANEHIRLYVNLYTNTQGSYNLFRINDSTVGTVNFTRLFIVPLAFYEDAWSGVDKY